MTAARWMALCFALGSACFLVGPFPGYVQLVGEAADGITFFVGSILFTAGGALQCRLAWAGRSSDRSGPCGVVERGDPVRRDALLQRNHVPRAAHRNLEPAVQPAGLATGRLGIDLLPGLGGNRVASSHRVMGGCPRAEAPGGGRPPSTCSAASSSGSPRWPARGPVDGLHVGSGRGELEHVSRGGVLSVCAPSPRCALREVASRVVAPRLDPRLPVMAPQGSVGGS